MFQISDTECASERNSEESIYQEGTTLFFLAYVSHGYSAFDHEGVVVLTARLVVDLWR